MTRLIVDAFAWIAYLDVTSPNARDAIENTQNQLITPIIVFSGVVSKVKRKGMDHGIASEAMLTNSSVAGIDIDLATKAALLHAETRQRVKDFSLPDAFVLATARKHSAKILTGNQHFKGFKEAVMIE